MNLFREKIRELCNSKGLSLKQATAYLEIATVFIIKDNNSKTQRTKKKAIRLGIYQIVEGEDQNTIWWRDNVIEKNCSDPFVKQELNNAKTIVNTFL